MARYGRRFLPSAWLAWRGLPDSPATMALCSWTRPCSAPARPPRRAPRPASRAGDQGALTVFAAGPDAARTTVQPVFDAIGSKTVWLGQEPGAASRLKLVVNSWVLALTSGAAEAVALAQGLDLDPGLFLDAVSGGPLDCPYLHTKAGAIINDDFSPSFSAEMAGKDARLIVEAAGQAGIRMDVAAAVAERLRRTVDFGHGSQDMAATYFASFDGTRGSLR